MQRGVKGNMTQEIQEKLPKPPLGVIPRKLRALDVIEAIERYHDAGYGIKKEWILEIRI